MRPRLALAFLILSALLAGTAGAQQTPPDFDLDSLSPAAGWQTQKKITVTGEFTDDRGFRDIEYRVRGKSNWKEASFVTEGNVASGTITASFSFNVRLDREEYSRVEIRARDVDGNESDSVTRRYRWDRYGFHVRDDGSDTGGGNNGGGNNGGGNDGGGDRGGGDGGGDNGGGGSDTVTINSFSATPNVVSIVGNITLEWDVSGAVDVAIDNGVGTVSLTGSQVIPAVTQTTTWTLTATDADGGTQTATATTEVSGSIFPGQ